MLATEEPNPAHSSQNGAGKMMSTDDLVPEESMATVMGSMYPMVFQAEMQILSEEVWDI
jgi:hypothetical protein